MADEQAVFRVHFDAVRSCRAAGELDGDASLGDRAVGNELQAPDLLGPCDSDIAVLLRRGQRDAVRAGHVGAEAVKRAVGAQSVDASSGIGNAGLPLVGEVEVAVGGEVQVVQALKTL